MAGRRYQRKLAGVLLALAAACSRDDRRAVPTATVPTQVTTTTTTGPYAVPAVIDEAYVNRVLAGLDAVIGDVVRIVVRERQLTPEAMDRLKAVYVGEARTQQLRGLSNDAADGLSEYKDNPGNRKTTVSRLVTADARCIFGEVARDYSAVSRTGQTGVSSQWVVLRPIARDDDRQRYNPTGWALAYDGFEQDQSEPRNQCVP